MKRNRSFRYCCLFALCGMMLSGCVNWRTVQHLGRTYPAVQSVDVIYAERDIKSPKYEFMGEVFIMPGTMILPPDVEQMLVDAAKQRGASAIWISYNLTSQSPMENSPYFLGPILRGRLIHYLP